MATRTGDAPTRAWALGELAALLARAPALPPQGDPNSDAALSAVEQQGRVLRALLETRKDQEFARNVAARALAQVNQQKADLVPQHAKTALQVESLRRAQLATSDQAAQRAIRRQRAEFNVRLEDLKAELAGHDRRAESLRLQVAQSERDIADNEKQAAAERTTLDQLQDRAPPLSLYTAALGHRMAVQSAQFFLASTGERRAAFFAGRKAAADDLLALFADIGKGRFRQSDVDAFVGGRSMLIGEVLWGLVAIGDGRRAAAVFEAMQPAPFSHQIYSVFRAFVPGLLLLGREDELREAVAAHRYTQGVRGAVAEAAWRYVEDNAVGFVDALKTLPVYDWRQGHGSGYEAFGLVCTTAAGLARLGRLKGWQLPEQELKLTAPAELWRDPPKSAQASPPTGAQI